MKRFLIPFTLAILIHVLLLRFEGQWASKRFTQPQPDPIALALTYSKPETPPTPSLPSPRQETPEEPQTLVKPQEMVAKEPPVPKPEPVKPKPPRVRKKTREITRKDPPVPKPKPEPPQRPTTADENPLATQALSPLPAPEQPEPSVGGPADREQALKAPSPAQRDSEPDAKHQVAALTPVKKLKEAVPNYRQNPPPSYPRIARRKGYEGTVVLEVLVGPEGRVNDLRVFQSCGHAVLDEAAADSVRTWLFEPGTIGDRPVEMWVRVPVRFQLKE